MEHLSAEDQGAVKAFVASARAATAAQRDEVMKRLTAMIAPTNHEMPRRPGGGNMSREALAETLRQMREIG
jgi:hypothetical protein